MKPSAANPLKRGGFLEVRLKQSHYRVGSNPQSAPICKFSSQSLPCGASPPPRNSQLCSVPNRRRCFDRLAFKKTCPCVPSRAGVAQHGRQRTNPTRSLGGPFSGIARLSKGATGFLARGRNPSGLGYQESGERSEPKRISVSPCLPRANALSQKPGPSHGLHAPRIQACAAPSKCAPSALGQ